MHEENPGLAMARLVPVVRTGANAAGMAEAMAGMSRVLAKLARGEELGSPEEEGIFPRARRNTQAGVSGAERAVDMLLAKLAGRPYRSEVARPLVTELTPAAAVLDLEHARVALVTTGGVVPRGNPDRIESNNATHYAVYQFDGLQELDPAQFECFHSGFDTTYANLDPDRVVPLDAMRELEAAGRFGSLHDRWFVTTGNLTAIRRAEAFGRAIAAELTREGVQAVVLTAT
jgi:glycine reductase